jgi:cysteinyl-tRNA synthetase
MRLWLYNTLSRAKEPVSPRDPNRVTLYSCGPTVYRDAHLGNLRTFLMADWIKRVLRFLGYEVFHVKNITDVGHMRQEMLERGEDKIIAAARKAGLTSREIAEHYTRVFLEDEARLNILPADVFPRATEHISHCIELIKVLIQKGHAYVKGGNVYFDVESFPNYGALSGNILPNLLEAVRVEADPLKRNPQDFTLWKAAEPGREMKWDSPWGEGFPGWHIECSAMSLHYIGEHVDIHTGGVDNIFPHHEDEMAQSEAAVGHRVVGHWVHGQHLLADGAKMAKSAANDYTIRDLEERGYDPLAFRYLCLTVHYRSRLNFTFRALGGAQRGLSHLRRHVEDGAWRDVELPREGPGARWIEEFTRWICHDLALPRALAVVWSMLHDESIPHPLRSRILVHCDQVLGLDLASWPEKSRDLPPEVQEKVRIRHEERRRKNFTAADSLRMELERQGVELRDHAQGTLALRRSRAEWKGAPREISSSGDVPNLLEEEERYDFTVSLVACDNGHEVLRCYEALKAHGGGRRIQTIIVEGGSRDATRRLLQEATCYDPDCLLVLADHRLGEAASRNVALRQALGRIVLLVDPCVEPVGDIFSPVERVLEDREVGVTGAMGLLTKDCQNFEEGEGPEVHAITIYFMAIPRDVVRKAGFMDERFRFYRHLDLDYSFRIRHLGYKAVVAGGLPLKLHPSSLWENMDPEERERRSRANFYIFYRKWHHHTELFG